jgi:hypothetical protein
MFQPEEIKMTEIVFSKFLSHSVDLFLENTAMSEGLWKDGPVSACNANFTRINYPHSIPQKVMTSKSKSTP